ncbi:MAG TPA: sialidase family protein [Solirubrobacteraceae bacterium]|nr:sialidase family protein [Solirubrobacteraceae bacterium]
MSRLTRSALLASCSLLTCAAPAVAGTDVPLGHGRFPDVVVTDDGTAHVAWVVHDAAAPDAVQYCAVPRGAAACAQQATLPVPDELSGLDLLAGEPGQLALVAQGAQRTVALGFAPPALPDAAAFKRAGSDVDIERGGVAYAGGGLFVSGGPGRVQAFKLGEDAPDHKFAELPTSFNTPTFGAIGMDGATPVQAAADGDHTELFRYAGPLPATPESIAAAGSWSGPAAVAPALSEPTLAGGASGLKLFGAASPGGFPSRPRVAPVGGAPADIQKATDAVFEQTFAQHAATGRLHATWRVNDPDGGHIRFVKSTDGGATWSRLGDLSQRSIGGTGNGHANLNVSSAADQQGLVVYEGEVDPGNTSAEIRAVSLDVVPKHVQVAATAKQGRSLTGPAVCIPENGFFPAKVKGAKVVSASLAFDGTSKAGRKATFGTAGLAPASKHTLRAKLVVAAAGTTVVKKLTRTVTVCG